MNTSSHSVFKNVLPEHAVLGIIGGSGVYNFPHLTDAAWVRMDTPWGEMSDAVRCGYVNGRPVAFLPRHGRGHKLAPAEINYRANIAGLKQIGVTDIVSVSACGSLNIAMNPGDFVLVDQYVDRTFTRANSFFGEGIVAHVGLARPASPKITIVLQDVGVKCGMPLHMGGTLIVIDGPQFSSLAESQIYRQLGCDVIGMTGMPEAKLAREAEIAYATVAMVTDFDCWHPNHDDVDVASVVAVAKANADRVNQLLLAFLDAFPIDFQPCPVGSDKALDFAIMTAPDQWPSVQREKLASIASRVLGDG